MASIFHYTDNKGAIGIIGSNQIYATDYRFLNDSHEMQLIRTICANATEKVLQDFFDNLDGAKALASAGLTSNYLSTHAEKIIQALMETGDRLSPMFVASFCRHQEGSVQWDHGLLSQWRAYGGQSGGCALEFDREALALMLKSEKSAYRYSVIKMNDVSYDGYDQIIDRRIIEKAARTFINQESGELIYPGNIKYNVVLELFNLVFGEGPFLKKPAFYEEQEVRIAAAPIAINSEGVLIKQKKKSIEFRFRSDVPVPFVKLFGMGEKLPIKRVLVGPQFQQDKVVTAMRLFLDQNGHSIDVKASDISFVR